VEMGEGYILEVKESLSSSVDKDICAFVNASGGLVKLGCCGLVRMGCCCLDGLCHGFLMDVVSRIYDIFDHIGLVFERFGVFLKVFLINGGRDDC